MFMGAPSKTERLGEEVVDKSDARIGKERPCDRANKGRQIIGNDEGVVEETTPRRVGAARHPGKRYAHRDRDDGGKGGAHEGIDDGLEILGVREQACEIRKREAPGRSGRSVRRLPMNSMSNG